MLFASITNWNDMYEENFEGGREFLRVLNEVNKFLTRQNIDHFLGNRRLRRIAGSVRVLSHRKDQNDWTCVHGRFWAESGKEEEHGTSERAFVPGSKASTHLSLFIFFFRWLNSPSPFNISYLCSTKTCSISTSSANSV